MLLNGILPWQRSVVATSFSGIVAVVRAAIVGAVFFAPAAGAGPVAGHTLCAPASILVASGYACRRHCARQVLPVMCDS